MSLIVNKTIENEIRESKVGMELVNALDGIFYSIESYRKDTGKLGNYESFYCKPTKNISAALLLDDREILVVSCEYTDIQGRILKYTKSVIDNSASRLSPRTAIIIHEDLHGSNKLRKWGREQGIIIIPICRDKVEGIGNSENLRKKFAWDIFSSNSFDVTGPVTSDEDFFGRRSEAIELMKQLENGRIRSLFGMRKVGKTSLINRCIEMIKRQTNLSVVFIDCSDENFYSLDSIKALSVLAGLIKRLLDKKLKYVSNSFEQELPTADLNSVLKELVSKEIPLVLIFDEIDYISPSSPTNETWKLEFNKFWRTLRVYMQEAQRIELRLSLLIGGVSSKWFKQETINGIENAVLHFIPDEYLSSFPHQASIAMIKSLGMRAGLMFTEDTASLLANECADFAFWIRRAGSYIHKHVPIEARPYSVTKEALLQLIDSFISQEGIDIVSVALGNLTKVFPEVFEAFIRFIDNREITLVEKSLLEKYGLIKMDNGKYIAACTLLREAAKIVNDNSKIKKDETEANKNIQGIILDNNAWAEEIAVVSRRRNIIEKRIRGFIRFGLSFTGDKSSSWSNKVLVALPEKRRQELSTIVIDELMEKLNLLELIQIISKYWDVFQKYFGDKNTFNLNATTINDRPDCHAKDRDLLDFVIYRKALDYFEDVLRK